MNQYTFARNEKIGLSIGMGLGVICLLLTYIGDDPYHSRFWSNFLHNSVFFTGIAFLALFLLCAKVIAYSGWHVVFKRIWEAHALFLLMGILLMLIIIGGVWLRYHHLYHWAEPEIVLEDEILSHKSAFLNPLSYTIFTLAILGVWYYFARKMRSFSLAEDNVEHYNYSIHKKKTRVWASIFLPLGGFSSAAVIWQWVMSLDPHWYSTLFAWYCTISWLIAMLCVTVLMIVYLKSKGYFQEVTPNHLHDLGKYIFGFSIFWAYLWFSQYMLIWYGNIGEETIYFKQRIDQYPVLFYSNLGINFILPLLILMRNDTKRKIGTMSFISILLILGHWLDYFLMIKPGVWHAVSGYQNGESVEGGGHSFQELGSVNHLVSQAGDAAMHGEQAVHFAMGFSIPGLLELGTFIGFGAFFTYFVFRQLERAPLIPLKDPYIDESLHHHV